MNERNNKATCDSKMIRSSIVDTFKKLSPKTQAHNPVMMLIYISSLFTTLLFILSFFVASDAPKAFTLFVAIALWSTVLFVNFVDAIEERIWQQEKQ